MICLLFTIGFCLLAFIYMFVFYFKKDSDLLLSFYDTYYPNLNSLKGKTVWVVGASTGIGREIAFECARYGCRIILTATSLDKLQENRKKCIELSNGQLKDEDVYIAAFSITDIDQTQKHYDEIIAKFGHIDLLVNNAGVAYASTAIEFENEELDRVMATNFFGNIRVSKLVAKEWVRSKREGKIIVTSSISAFVPIPFYSIYIASKCALHGFYNVMRNEVAHLNISITLASPAGVKTEIAIKPVAKDNLIMNQDFFSNPRWIMNPERCARLMLVAGTNRFSDVFLATQPQVFILRIFEIFGVFIRPIMAYFISEKQLKNLHSILFSKSKNE